jgi:tetratricopeptide (TPR) repeat protein
MRASLAGIVTVIVLGGVVTAARANEASLAKAREAMLLCESVDRMPPGDKALKIRRLEEGLQVGEAAVALDEHDPRAHLAVFCNLGKGVDLAGLSWRVFGQVRRMQTEVDRAQTLDPDDVDVLIAKGEMLHRLPGLLGGNKEEGERLLRRAVDLRPDHVVGRLYLARALADDHSPAARASVYEALAVAKRAGAVREQTEAQQLLASLHE